MDFSVEKYISNFIQSQFPAFYRDEGENFTLFVKAYYEWMETQGQPIIESRNLLNYRDIDDTLEKFLEYFQKKYLYGIPFNVISNKRFLLKHILDVYRSKGTIQCYRLLFKLIYDEDIKIYLPSTDYIRPSDGTWKQPKYLEITPAEKNKELLGKIVVGTSSKTKAVVENYIREKFDKDIIDVLYISNVLPKGGDFIIGEKIVLESDLNDFNILDKSPTIIGSFDKLKITNGGQGFRVGDLLKLVHKDLLTNEKISSGKEGIVKVIKLASAQGQMNFDIFKSGFGYANTSKIFFYPNLLDTGQGASFKLLAFSDTREIKYNTDLICDYLGVYINAVSYGLTGNTSANLSSTLSNTTFKYKTETFGSIASLSEIRTGNGYEYSANVFVRSIIESANLSGSITYTTSCTHITGTSTEFQKFFSNGDVIYIQANTLPSSGEYAVIKTVSNNINLVLYAKPKFNSTINVTYKVCPVVFTSNFASYEPLMKTIDGSIPGKNEIITATPASGSDIVAETVGFDSGKAYVNNEIVSAYLYGSIETPTIVSPGANYTNNDLVMFSGGGENFISPPDVKIITNNSGNIVSISVVYFGSGYTENPSINIKSVNGTGGLLTTKVKEFNDFSEVKGRVIKKSIGQGQGYWTTTRGFLNSDKYIHDSHYYQDYSYEIRVPFTLENYKDILYNTFHSSGSELFGKYTLDHIVNKKFGPLYDNDYAFTVQITDEFYSLTSDTTITQSGMQFLTVDMYDAFTVIANTSYIDSVNNVIKINNSSNTFGLNDYVYYQVPNPPFKIIANSAFVNAVGNYIKIDNSKGIFGVDDRVFYSVPSGNTAIAGLTAGSFYYVSFANSSSVALSEGLGDSNVNITDTRTTNPGEEHTLLRYSAIAGLTANSYYYVSYANLSHIALSDTKGGANLDLTETRTRNPGDNHTIYVVEKAE